MIGCHGNGSKCSKTWISLILTWIISSLGWGQQLPVPGPRLGKFLNYFLIFCSDSASGSKFDACWSLKSKLSLKRRPRSTSSDSGGYQNGFVIIDGLLRPGRTTDPESAAGAAGNKWRSSLLCIIDECCCRSPGWP